MPLPAQVKLQKKHVKNQMKIYNNCINFIIKIKKKIHNLNCNFRNSYKYKSKYFPNNNKELYLYRDNLMDMLYDWNKLLDTNLKNYNKYNELLTLQLNNLLYLEILNSK